MRTKTRETGGQNKIGRFPLRTDGKALSLGENTGFVKVNVDEEYGEVLVAHMVGPEVTEPIPVLTLAKKMN